ncbi:MAG TPA: response regulator [Bradyrhizobium sp.]|jgi:two-component system OmpR family response regulator|nr:response regulator [Bradyrhizobium sp.]
MTTLRILHIDDEPDIREVVEISLGLDPGFATRSCSSGEEAIAAAIDWQPDIILCDVMMPVMDGPATLMRLRENVLTASIPVIFMTARAQTRELDRFRSLGALGVIPKPFDPMTLAASVRSYVQPTHDPLDDLRAGFLQRVKKDAAALSQDRLVLRDRNRLPATLGRIKHIAHGLSGAGGIYGFAEISDAAAALEDAVIAELADPGLGQQTDRALDGLIFHAGNPGESAGQMVRPVPEA